MYDGISSPYILEERELHVQQLDIISRLQMERIIFLGSEINSDTANIIIAQLLYLQSIGDQPVTMMISSPGGEILSIHNVSDWLLLWLQSSWHVARRVIVALCRTAGL